MAEEQPTVTVKHERADLSSLNFIPSECIGSVVARQLGRNANGRLEWRDAQGQALKALQTDV